MPSLPPPELPDSRSSYRTDDPPAAVEAPPAAIPSRPRLLEPLRPAEAAPPVEAAPPRELLLPDPLPGTASRKTAVGRLGDPIRPAAATSRPPAGFVRVPGRDGLATGRPPADGETEWMAANGFRTVLLLHDAKAQPPAAASGLKGVAVAVDPTDLRPAVAALATAAGPVYVADADPDRAAAVWYAVFRTRDFAGDEVARLRANGLGGRAERAAVWPAVQRLTSPPR